MTIHIFKLPDLGEGTVEAEIAEWQVNVGDAVNEEDVLGAMMTDKAAVDISAPVTGTITALAGEPGDIVAVGAPLVTFEIAESDHAGIAEPAASAKLVTEPDLLASSPSEPAAVPVASPQDSSNAKLQTSPAIRRLSREAGVDLSLIRGTGPRGRILRIDYDDYVRGRSRGGEGANTRRRTGTEAIKVIGLRRIIAERMASAKRSIPHFSYVEEVDVTEIEKLRALLNDRHADSGLRLSLLPFIGTAITKAIESNPSVNAIYDEGRNSIIRHHAVHLGVAVQTDAGLKVPVVQHAESLGLTALAAEIVRLSEAARDSSIQRSELSGSTITLTSLGKLGGIVSTPVINAPEVGIIGVNRAVDRPMVVDGQVQIRTMMNLSSSFDHRFVDGYDAAKFIQDVKVLLEHPAALFIDL